MSPELVVHPVTPDRWPDLEKLFGPNGAYSGCWCMYWRLKRSEFDRATSNERKAGLKELVDSAQPPGLLGYVEEEPVAWVSLGPRESYLPLERSRTRPRIDDRPVWSIVCFYFHRKWRRQGLMAPMLRGAAEYAFARGAEVVEGYPVDPPPGVKVPGGDQGYVGIASAFRKAGFVEAFRPGQQSGKGPAVPRLVMRCYATGAAETPAPEI
jgi:GNAT superfamily N-acetyltransferase